MLLLKKEKRNLIQTRMRKVNDDVKKINDEILESISELNALVVATFLRQSPGKDRYPKNLVVLVESKLDDNNRAI